MTGVLASENYSEGQPIKVCHYTDAISYSRSTQGNLICEYGPNSMLIFTVTRDVIRGEELTINCGDDWSDFILRRNGIGERLS